MAVSKTENYYKTTAKKYSFEVGVDWNKLEYIEKQYPTPCFMTNFILSGDMFGGVSAHKAYMFAGKNGTFKSNKVLIATASICKKDPTALILFYDYEGVGTKGNFEKVGIDTDTQLFEPRKFSTSEQLNNLVLQDYDSIILNDKFKGRHIIVMIDGIGMVGSEKTLEKGFNNQTDNQLGNKAKSLNLLASTLMNIINKHKVTLLVCNHTYDDISSLWGGQKVKGGEGFPNICDTIVLLSEKRLGDKDTSTGTGTGSIFKMQAIKSRNVSKNFIVNLEVSYESGINPFSGLFDMALNVTGNIVKDTATSYSLINTSTGELLKFNDKETFKRKDVENNMDFWKIVFNQTNFHTSMKDKLYIKDKPLIKEKELEVWDFINDFSK